jgi:hypothetical protein
MIQCALSEINAPQYFAAVAPEQPPSAPHHEYYAQHMGPPMPPPPLPEPQSTSNVSLDPLLQSPPHAPPPLPPAPTQTQGSEAIIDAAKAERTAQDRERGRLRVQRFRMKRKLADAEAGKRDKETLKKIKFPLPETQVSSLDFRKFNKPFSITVPCTFPLMICPEYLLTTFRREMAITMQVPPPDVKGLMPRTPRLSCENASAGDCVSKLIECARSWPRPKTGCVTQLR